MIFIYLDVSKMHWIIAARASATALFVPLPANAIYFMQNAAAHGLCHWKCEQWLWELILTECLSKLTNLANAVCNISGLERLRMVPIALQTAMNSASAMEIAINVNELWINHRLQMNRGRIEILFPFSKSAKCCSNIKKNLNLAFK